MQEAGINIEDFNLSLGQPYRVNTRILPGPHEIYLGRVKNKRGLRVFIDGRETDQIKGRFHAIRVTGTDLHCDILTQLKK